MSARLVTRSPRLALAISLVIAAAAGARAERPVRSYTVQPGDSLWSIAEEFYGRGARYRLIYRYNDLPRRGPHILRPGQVLLLPEGDVLPEAHVAWSSDGVRAKPPRSLDWLRASAGMNLWQQYELATERDAAVHVAFEELADLGLAGDSLLLVRGGPGERKKKARRGRREMPHVVLRHGMVRGGLREDPRDAGTEVRVVTAPATFAIAGRDALVVADDAIAKLSVFDGEVRVQVGAQHLTVAAGQGLTVARGARPEAPSELLAAPEWSLDGDTALVMVVPPRGHTAIPLAWTAVPGAHGYRVELARDPRFLDLELGLETSKPEVVLAAVPGGRFFARVSARDGGGVQGRAASALPIDVIQMNASRRMTLGEHGRWEVVGLVHLDLGDRGDALEWALDGEDFDSGTVPRRIIGRGAHTIEVKGTGQGRVTKLAIDVLGIDAELDLGPKERMHAGQDERRTLLLSLRDERGRPAVVPGLVLEVEPGGELPLKALEPGRWTAELAAPQAPGPREIIVRARWLGGALAAGRILVERQLMERYVYRWREATLAASWDGDLTATALPSVRPIDRVGTSIAVERRADETHLGVMVRGEHAALDGVLGLDGALTFFRLPLDSDDPVTNELGDMVLGARYLVRLQDRRVTLAPSLRARVPLGRFEGVAVALEPAGLLRWRALERLWVDTRQGLYGAIGKRGEASYIGDYALLWMPFGIEGALAVTAQLDTQQGLSGGAFALAAGGGLAFRIQRVRVGLQLGGGIGEGGRARYGDVFGALTVDFGLGTP